MECACYHSTGEVESGGCLQLDSQPASLAELSELQVLHVHMHARAYLSYEHLTHIHTYVHIQIQLFSCTLLLFSESMTVLDTIQCLEAFFFF